jgi:hypothetical protein
VDPTPVVGDNIIVAVANTNTEWEYSLVQINGNVTLGTAMGTGSTYYFDAGALTPDDVLDGLVVIVTEPTIGCSLNSDTLFVDFVTGIILNSKTSLSIFPNPFQDYIIVRDSENKISELSVFDLNGRLMIEETHISRNQKTNLSQLSKGVYFISLTYQSGEKKFRKIIKE